MWRWLTFAGGVCFAWTVLAAAAERPNVLFIVVDDLRPSLGCFGAGDVSSPNIDRLAARGMRFERAYCQYPICNPSRSSFLSGLRPDQTGIFENTTPIRTKHPDLVLLPQLFRQHGYFTAGLGKVIHAGVNAEGRRVFFEDGPSWVEFRNFEPTPVGRRGERRNLTGGELKWCSWLAAEGGDEDQPDGQLAAEAVRLINAPRSQPWFIAVGFHKPHDPFNAPKAYFDRYALDRVRLARDPDDRSPLVPMAIPGLKQFSAFTDQERREFKRAYYAGVSFMDAQVGKLLDALDRQQLWEKTVVVLIGDHGYHLGEHGWWNKGTVFEHSARPPLIVWAPGRAGMGRATRGIVEFVDLFPTLADLCALKPSHALAGRSVRGLLDDPAGPGKPAAYTQVVRGATMGRSVRTDRWRYTEWDEGRQGVELYDHQADPLEYHNRADDPRWASVVSEHQALLATGK